ncbi:UDP-glucose 4-epimerase GalE [Lysinibacillus halotolerans]
MAILVTGGAGYIGSHAAVELLGHGYEIVIVDNLSNSHIEAVNRIKELSGKEFPFYQIDLMDRASLDEVFKKHQFEAVMHFAGLKAVGESVQIPLKYYQNNITGTLNLVEVMAENDVKKLVFSSSATVYGYPETVPIDESFPLSVTNPYGRTKLMVEDILRDLHQSDSTWKIALLRYFNPIGAHVSGRIGESPVGIPNNLMPYITQVAIGRREKLNVYGNDYNTSDGTGVRDYIHVVDLVLGHIKALEYLDKNDGIETFNLGTGTGYSVLELVHAFEAATGKDIPYEIVDRRAGDVAICYANPAKAEKLLGWKAEKTLQQMCEDSWRWQVNNPVGYEDK